MVEGMPVVRVRRMADGTIAGEWIRPAAVAVVPPGRARAPGPSADARELREIVGETIKAAGMMDGLQQQRGDYSVASSFADQSRRRAAAAREHELKEVFARRATASHTSSEPRYLDLCALRSDLSNRRYRVCAVENAHDRCPDWEPAR